MTYVFKRLGFYLIAAWVALTINFLLPRMMPGDPATAMMARFEGQLQPEAMAALRETFAFNDDPWWIQYVQYVRNTLTGDFGTSIAFFPTPVAKVIGTGLMWTCILAGSAVLVSFTLGTLLGIISAWRRDSFWGQSLPPILSFLGAFPYFWLAMLALWLFGFTLGWFPLRHAYGEAYEPGWNIPFLVSAFRHAILPATTIVLATLGNWLLRMRNNMIAVLGEDYISLARAKGLASSRILFQYAARNAVLPSVTGFGMALGFVVSGSLLTEIIFAYPGQGYLLIQAVRTQDFALMQGLFLAITFAVLAANWFVDILYMWLDPRTRSSRSS